MTEWSAYTHYQCQQCAEICINLADADCAQLTICRSCHQDVRAEDILDRVEEYLKENPPSTADTSERAEEATPSHGGPPDRVSASPRAERRGESQRESPAEGPERGCGTVQSLVNAATSSDFDE